MARNNNLTGEQFTPAKTDPKTDRTLRPKFHGVRGKSGRKPGAYTQLRRRIETERVDDAEYGFALYVGVMRNEDEELPVRLSAADWVVRQVVGNPKNRDNVTGEVLVRIIRESAHRA